MTERYRFFDQTSDLGLEIFGADRDELFANGAFALFDNIVRLEGVEERSVRELEVRGTDLADLFLDWLRELLFLFSTELFIVKRVEVVAATETQIRARLFGETFDRARHEPRLEIKTPTYHMYEVKKTRKGYRARVVLDV